MESAARSASRSARAGAAVAINDLLPDRAEAAAGAIAQAGGRSLALPADVTVATNVRQLVARAYETFGTVDILLTCAANYGRRAELSDMAEGEWESVVRCHLDGTAYACQAVIPQMKAGGWGRIVTFSSMVGLTGFPGASHYAAAKGAVENLTKSLAVELAPHGINVNCIAPGYTDTPLLVGPYSDAERGHSADHTARSNGNSGRHGRRGAAPGRPRWRLHHGNDDSRRRGPAAGSATTVAVAQEARVRSRRVRTRRPIG